ncbi:Hypothetical predicted protein, partial [Marmota monax]
MDRRYLEIRLGNTVKLNLQCDPNTSANKEEPFRREEGLQREGQSPLLSQNLRLTHEFRLPR